VDILEHVPEPLHEALVGEMDKHHADETRELEQYAPDTAGGIMTTEVTALYEYITVDDAITLLRRLNEELEQMFYVYVIDRRKHLVGVLSMRDLILAKPEKRLREIMIPRVRSVPATMDQEQVAKLMREGGFLAMPVVDAENKLIGLITHDDVLDVLEEEATEDVQRMFGAGAEERLNSPWHFSFKKRVWWLVVNLATAFLAAAVVGMFEDTITRLAILAAYMPIVAGMGGNASAQAMAVAVRGLATGKVDRQLMQHVLRAQLFVGVTTGIVIGAITMAIAVLLHPGQATASQTVALGAVVCAALIINHTLACTSGAAIPFFLKRLGFDPAQSATIFATTTSSDSSPCLVWRRSSCSNALTAMPQQRRGWNDELKKSTRSVSSAWHRMPSAHDRMRDGLGADLPFSAAQGARHCHCVVEGQPAFRGRGCLRRCGGL
jgi:magnesium transporter